MPLSTIGPRSWLDATAADLGMQQVQPLIEDVLQRQQASQAPSAPMPSFSSGIPSLQALMGQPGQTAAPTGQQSGQPAPSGYLSSLPSLNDLLSPFGLGQQQPALATAPGTVNATFVDGRIQPKPVPSDSRGMQPGETVGAVTAVSGGGDLEAYARHKAQQLGIDPDTAARVANTEGGFGDPTRQNTGGAPAYGPYQLYIGGADNPGLGDEALQQGIDPRNPAHAQAAIDFALEHVAKNGWGAFQGAAAAGIGNWDGIGQAAPSQSPQQPAAASGEPQITYKDQWGNQYTSPESKFNARPGGNSDVTVVSRSSANPAAAGVAAPQQAASGTPAAMPSNAPSSTYTQQGLADAGDPDAWAKCGPVAAFQFAQRMGRNPTPAEVEQLARQAGWTGATGMRGLDSEASVLKGMGIAAHSTRSVDWSAVIADVQRGNPVILELPGHEGHYVTAQGYDPQTGRIDFGSTVGDLAAAHHRTAFTPDEFPSLGWGSPSGALFLDNPATPAPSVVAGQSAPNAPPTPAPAGGAAAATGVPPAPVAAPDQTPSSWSPDAPAQAAPAYSAPAGRGGGGGVMSLQRPSEPLPYDPRDVDQGPHEWRPEWGTANYPPDDAGRQYPTGSPAIGSWPGDSSNPLMDDNGQAAPRPYVPDRTDPSQQPRAVPNSPYVPPGRAYGAPDDAMYRQPLGATQGPDTATGDQQPQSWQRIHPNVIQAFQQANGRMPTVSEAAELESLGYGVSR